jgi:NhaA family Na+:H+ antiporter
MVIFFFVIGLEIKREVIAGELSTIRQAIFPIFAAIGGMIVPMIIFISFGLQGEASQGWGIPMATDIAFSLAVLSMLGTRVPLSLKIFLTALAIVDDLGAILVIAVFYSQEINWLFLGIAAVLLSLLYLANHLNIQTISLYTSFGFIIWFLFLKSGIHPTIAGVLIAFAIPARPKVLINDFIPKIVYHMDAFSKLPIDDSNYVLNNDQLNSIDKVEQLVVKVQSPLQRIEHDLSGVVNYAIVPLFALANAGVTLLAPDSPISSITTIFTSLSLIIAISLIFGKMIGISLFSWLAVKFKLAVKPNDTSWLAYIGIGLLAGIGFTMSLFIASLAFVSPELLDQAKVGIFAGSIISGFAGFFLLKYAINKNRE